MSMMDMLSIFSLFVGLTSIGMALYAMNSSKRSEERTRDNFERTQAMMQQFYDKTKDLLNEVDKRASIIESVTTNSQEKLLSTMTTILNETVIPKKEDMGEQLGLLFFQHLLSNPQNAASMMETLKPFIEAGKKQRENTE
jgi:predicted component of viral defense system (DUF524 family)